MNEHFLINLGQCCSKTTYDLVNPGRNWEQRCTWRTSLYHHPLKHGYWLMWACCCIWMNDEKMQTTKTDCGTRIYLKDIIISSSFETWLLTDMGIWLHLNEYWKDAHHQPKMTGSGLAQSKNNFKKILLKKICWFSCVCFY